MRTLLAILLIMVLGSLVLSMPVVQTKLAKYATDSLNEEFGTNIQIDRVSLSLFNLNAGVKGIYVEDYQQDTLFYIHKLTTSVGILPVYPALSNSGAGFAFKEYTASKFN